MPSESLAAFINSVSGDDLLTVEEAFGDGFVRLRVAEAERRQAKHDIRAVEDIVVEMLRNSRDAHAKNIYLAVSREGISKTLVFIDDGDGVPPNMQERIFEPRVTSKLDTMVMDRWGVHGRGMALYSIISNAREAQVVTSDSDLGASIRVLVDLSKLTEKADQSTYPKLLRADDGSLEVGSGPHNVIRNVVEFSLEHKDKVNVYLGSPAEITARLCLDGSRRLSDDQLLFCDDVNDLPVALRPAAAADASELARISASIGLPISERTAHRIVAGQIDPAPAPLSTIIPMRVSKNRSSTAAAKPSLKLSKEDSRAFSDSLAQSFAKVMGQRYFLELNAAPKIKVNGDSITVKFSFDRD